MTNDDKYVILKGNQFSQETDEMPKGKKTCEKCGHQCGPRAYMCPECQHPFMFAVQSKEKRTTRMIRKFNWKDLEKGDKIKVTGGCYYISDEGEYIPMGCRGKFTVIGLDHNGIIAYGVKEGGFCHIWMGEDQVCPDTQIRRTKHRLAKLQPKLPKRQKQMV